MSIEDMHEREVEEAWKEGYRQALKEAEAAVRALPKLRQSSPDHVKANGPEECAAVIRALSL